jgi:intergrase/recombinase
MIEVTPKEVARFVQSKLGELKISKARCGNLLSEVVEHYPKYLNYLSNTLRL